MTVFCFIIAAARSGTTMLGDAVARSFRVTKVGETFHPAFTCPLNDFRLSPQVERRLNFHNLRLGLLRQHPELSFPSQANQSLILRAFLRHLEVSEEAERYLVDVKYASWHHLDAYWRLPHHPPFLLAELMRLCVPLVHLKRTNIFALYCSQKLAQKTDVWHVLEESKEPAGDLTIDLDTCLRELDDLDNAQGMFDRWLGDYHVHSLEYESLLDGDGFSKKVEATFADIFGMASLEPLSTRYRKVTPPLRDVVVNKDEVLNVLRGTAYQAMAEQALA
jgi:hypothetical protein